MAYGTQIYYGYKVTNNLSDVINPILALERLTLNIGDIDIIRGAASETGVVREDVIALSGLDKDVYKTLDRYIGDTSRYKVVLDQSAGVDGSLFGNLNVNGPFGGSAIRYKYLDTSDDSIKFADISTSRVSAWSTTTNPAVDADPIFYGGQVKISTGGSIITDKITWGQKAQPRLFSAEVPTHKITTSINGQTVKLYAMKSIPLKLDGYFRSFDGIVGISASGSLRVSWRVLNKSNINDIQSYPDIGTTTSSTLRYRSVVGAPRTIEIYYPPDNIRGITLPSVGISQLPAAQLSNLELINLSFNEFKQIPNLTLFSPTLKNLQLFRNNLYLAEDSSLRKFNIAVANRIPSTVTSMNMYSTYYGSIRCVDRSEQTGTGTIVGSEITSGIGDSDSMSVIEARFPSLQTLNLSRGDTGSFFGPDEYDTLAYLPSVPNTCENYFCASNDFRRVPTTGLKELTNLKNIDLSSNVNLLDDSTFSLASNLIVTVNTSRTRLPIADLRNKSALTSFTHVNSYTISSLFTNDALDTSYKFSGCTSLSVLNLFASNVSGFIPKFINNQSLNFVDLYASQYITGGRPDNGLHGYANGNTHVMYKDTFADSKNISFFRVLSFSLLEGKGFEEGTFDNLRNLDYLFWYSYRRTGRNAIVPLPSVSSCSNLRYFIMPVNDFSGSVPSMSSNSRILYIDLSNNKLTGPVPTYANKLLLEYVFLNNNQLSSFTGFNNTPRLVFVYLHNNQITGQIPDFSNDCPNLRRLYLFNNQFSGYTSGSFAPLIRLQNLDISNNNLAETDLNNIIDDLYKNYISAPRRNVSINLRGQTRAVGYNPSSVGTIREQEVREKITFLQSNGWIINIGG